MHPSKILKELGIAPLKHLGQNFQIDTHVVENCAAHIPAGSKILEIGPGLGAWTEVFLTRAHPMVLAEKDRTLAARWRQDGRVVLLEGDFLEMDIMARPIDDCTSAVGNLPFYITSDILLRILGEMPQITHALFGIQLEVAERLVCAMGSSLAIAISAQGKITMAGKISRSSFYPAPKVDAAIIAFTRMPSKPRPHLRLLLKAAFWGKRKVLGSALKKNPFWEENETGKKWRALLAALPANLLPLMTERADDLSVGNFCAIYDFLEA